MADEFPTLPVQILIIDDDEPHAGTVAEILERTPDVKFICTVAGSGEDGARLIERETFDVVVTDLKMDDLDGLEILRRAKDVLPEAEVIVLTGHGSINSAVTAMQSGAYTYLTKPLDVQELRKAVLKAATRLQLMRRNFELRRQLDERFGFEGVIGNSPQMKQVIDTLKAVAPTDANVLIQGENGTGKELVANAVHQNSPRKSKPFVPLNVAALPSSTLESELFGHESGAFTGATGRRIGKFEYASGGTLFLDEIGELPMETQVKLLRVLEERKVTRVGANEPTDINVRIVAATNADLEQAVADKKFREDLYYRLKVVEVRLPPLRARKEDIPLLLNHFRDEFAKRYGKEIKETSRAARAALSEFPWPGNIRQLRNTIERMVILDMDGILDRNDLPEDIAPLAAAGDAAAYGEGCEGLIGRPLEEVEKFFIEKALEETGGKRAEAARILGIGERTLFRKIDKFGLK